MLIRYLAAVSAGFSALAAFLAALPASDNIPTLLIVVVGGAAAFLAATVAVLTSPAAIVRMAAKIRGS